MAWFGLLFICMASFDVASFLEEPITDVAAGGTVSDSGSLGNNNGSLALDNNTGPGAFDGGCSLSTGRSGAAAWWMVDLGGAYTIFSLNLWSADDLPFGPTTGGDLLSNISVRVSASSDADNHTVSEECVYDDQARPSSSTWNLQCTNILSGRYVSIRRVEGVLIDNMWMCEVKILGVPGCTPGTYEVNGACIDCDLGSYADSIGTRLCTECPDGYTTEDTGSTNYTHCIAVPATTAVDAATAGDATAAVDATAPVDATPPVEAATAVDATAAVDATTPVDAATAGDVTAAPGTVALATSTDVDECTGGTDDCDVNAACFNTVGSFMCLCNAGYQGSGQACSDINECTSNADDCGSTNVECINTDGGYYCTCQTGYTGDGVTCTEIDECAEDIHGCHIKANCTNTEGGYICTCHEGYEGDGFSCSAGCPRITRDAIRRRVQEIYEQNGGTVP